MGVSRSLRRRPITAAAIITAVFAAGLIPISAATAAETATPERVVLTPPEHPDTSQSFTWRTGAAVLEGEVHIREVGATEWRVVEAYANPELPSNGVPTRTHSATVTGLAPATDYEYYVGTEGSVSATYTFTTAGAAVDGKPVDPFTFIYFGDAQNQLTDKWAPVVAQAFETYPDAVGTVNAGDLVNTGGNDSEWTEWFNAMDGYSQSANVIAAPGNHEYGGDEFLTNWKSNFEYDKDGPQPSGDVAVTDGQKQKAAYEEHMAQALAETAYYTDYQGVRFISLNASREQAGALMTPDDLPFCLIGCPNPTQLWLDMQARWLDSILADNPNKWAVAVFHQPVFSTAEGRDERDIRETWLPVFQSNDIDLVLMGHDHTYGRGFVDADATDTPGMTTGPVYTVAVSGPKYYDMQPEDDNVWTQNGASMVTRAGHTSTFQGITVTDDSIHYEAIVAAKWDDESTTDVPIGGVLDSFTITKYDDGTKWVTEEGMDIPAEGVPNPDQPGEEPETPGTPEEPAGDPADVPLGHEVVGALTSPTIPEPGATAFDPKSQTLFVGDQSADGKGLIEAIDVTTGEVLDSFEVGTPIQDLVYEPSLASVLVAAGNTIGSYDVRPGSFGEVSYGISEEDARVLSPAYDTGSGLTFFATEDGTIVGIDPESREVMTEPILAGPTLSRFTLDDVTGNLYAVFDNAEDGETGLRVYATRQGNAVIKEYPLDARASSLDLDPAQGLVYIGHSSAQADEAGISIVNLLDDTVARASADEFGTSVGGVSVDSGKGLVYVSSAAKTPAPVVVVGRWQAPRVLSSPAAVQVDAGATASFTAGAFGVPSPAVSWESRVAGGDEWVSVAGESTATLEVVATDELHGTQYRAVFTNTIDGEEFSTRSATATLGVVGAGDEEPGEEEPGEEEPGEENPGEPGDEEPTATPAAIDESQLTDATRGGMSATTKDGKYVFTVGTAHTGEWVGVYVHSTPAFTGWDEVGSSGVLTGTLPAGTPAGSHKLVALDADGELLGWAPITVAADGSLPFTGGTVPFAAIIAALLLLALGGGLMLVQRLRRDAQ